ncbi:unnamed protein product [Durusdinium trenchii]|uniref:Transmembrane protein n=1 Tax=Durusdinium trenchii TaxID=1381693 RepID=A0ABP0RR58_9DINO
MKVESEDFAIPLPPEAKPKSPSADPVSFGEATGVVAEREVAGNTAWISQNSLEGLQRCPGWQVIELSFTLSGLCCWTTMCMLDLFGYWPYLESDGLPSQVLSLSVLVISCTAFGLRQYCVVRAKDIAGRASQCRYQYQLVVLLASQWSLLCGAITWLVLHVSMERQSQVIAGLLAVLTILALLLCNLVYMLQRRRFVHAAGETPKEHDAVASRTSHEIEDLALASMTPALETDVPLHSVQPTDLFEDGPAIRPVQSDGGLSDNFIGHIMSGRSTCLTNARPSDIEKNVSDGSERQKKNVEFHEEPHRSSRGRWRPLFPTMSSLAMSPTASRGSMSTGLGESLRRGGSKFKFETEAEVEASLRKEITRHTLDVDSVFKRGSSPSPSMTSQQSQISSSKKEGLKSSRASSSSGLSDVSGDGQRTS